MSRNDNVIYLAVFSLRVKDNFYFFPGKNKNSRDVPSGFLEKIGPTAARFPPKMLPLTDQWVDFSPCRAIAPTLQ
jgi:hypothetical protein